jgi:CheY-like chemotaxis protein
VQHINAVAIRASEIVDLLMACAGGRDVSFEAVDLSKVVLEMISLLKVSLPSSVILDTRLDFTLPAIRANPAQIRQVILNLIKNSKEALQDREGTITITTGCVHTDCTTSEDGATDLPEGEYARLVVSDTGCGMSPDVRARVFDPFYTTKFTGRGLGLAVVQGVVRSHGGAIHVLSTPGRGSIFEVLMPYANRRLKDKSCSSVAPERSPTTGTILVVEDENALRLAVSKALEKNGFHVLAAETGEAAIELFRKHAETVNLLLLDLNLPGISGAEVLLQVRRIKPQVKVVTTTGYDPQIIGASYAWAGQPPSGFIRKPYRVTELLQMIRKLLVTTQVETHAAA